MPSVLATDGYKFSMAEAGWPLRTETFYYSHRRGGPHYLPFDVGEEIRRMLPGPLRGTEHARDWAFLQAHGYEMGGGYWDAMRRTDELVVHALPKGSWFFDREPVFTVTGPSALVSWLEPLVLQLHYRIQVATLAKLHPELVAPVLRTTWTCEEQRDIIAGTLDSVGVAPPDFLLPIPTKDWYFLQVVDRVKELIEIVGDPSRIFEVGMRGASCMGQHRAALQACEAYGVKATSNVLLAKEFSMRPVGTMGHEHVQRYGSDDAAFRAMRERRGGPSSFLLDTFDTMHSGLPTALALIEEDPGRHDSIRFDSGDKRRQFRVACRMARALNIRPKFILEDGFTAEKTRDFEAIREEMGVPPEDVLYGYGGYIVNPIPVASDTPMALTRDRVAAVYKLCQTGERPTMKFADAPGGAKESIPGRPVLYRVSMGPNKGRGFVAQEGEEVPASFVPAAEMPLTAEEAVRLAEENKRFVDPTAYFPSEETEAITRHLRNVLATLRRQ